MLGKSTFDWLEDDIDPKIVGKTFYRLSYILAFIVDYLIRILILVDSWLGFAQCACNNSSPKYFQTFTAIISVHSEVPGISDFLSGSKYMPVWCIYKLFP